MKKILNILFLTVVLGGSMYGCAYLMEARAKSMTEYERAHDCRYGFNGLCK